jgi:hypothetical protein
MEELLKVFIDGKGTFYQRVKLSDNIEKEPDTGFLYCQKAVLGHIGVQAYHGSEVGIKDKKVVYIRREAEDVFDEDSMKSIKGKPVTLNHPDEMVNSKNFKDHVVGFIDEVWREGDNIMGVIVIQDQKAIDAIESGEFKDLSLGYTARLVPDEKGDLVQKDIVVNHLSLVKEGRAKNARILDENTVGKGSEDMELDMSFEGLVGRIQKIEDTVFKTKTLTIEEHENTYDNETNEEVNVHKSQTITHRTVEDEKGVSKTLAVGDENKVEGEPQKMKTFIDFMNDFNVIKEMPKSDFRDKAYEALNAECKETLKVELPALPVVAIKDSVIEKSVGLADNQREEEQEVKKPLIADAQGEERFLASIYRSFDKKENARKYSSMTYHDVIDMLEGRK